MEKLDFLWVTYGGMREHNMVRICQGEDVQPTTVFNTVIGKMESSISMALYKSRFLEVSEPKYTILPEFADPSDPGHLRDVNLPFDFVKDSGLQMRTQVTFFQAVFQTLKIKEALEAACIHEFDFNNIFNHAVKVLGEQELRKVPASFSTTQPFSILIMMNSWLG